MNCFILSCTKKKLENIEKIEAYKLYSVSHFFRKSLAFAQSLEGIDKIYILSGKYGLIELDEKISPYNNYLKDKTNWESLDKEKIYNTLSKYDNVVGFLSKSYKDFLNNINIKVQNIFDVYHEGLKDTYSYKLCGTGAMSKFYYGLDYKKRHWSYYLKKENLNLKQHFDPIKLTHKRFWFTINGEEKTFLIPLEHKNEYLEKRRQYKNNEITLNTFISFINGVKTGRKIILD